ncbi:MAG: HemK2/MTQ2 family protein methyltransferase [Candidatus Micrarchaeota archaeon]
MEFTYRGLALTVLESVYPPAEDSIMLARAAEALHGKVLEMGCGCGLASLACAVISPDSLVLGADINPMAVKCAVENAKRNGIRNVRFMESDLFSGLDAKKFDAILFNPPYLPTSEAERIPGQLNHAFDGGSDGRQVIDRFLEKADAHLKPGGILLIVQSSLNDLEKTRSALAAMSYEVEIADEEKFFFERIYLLKAQKPTAPSA